MVRILELGEGAQKRDHDRVGLLVVDARAGKPRHQYRGRLIESGDGIDSCVQFDREVSVVPQCDAQPVDHDETESEYQAIVLQCVARRISVHRHEVPSVRYSLDVLCIKDGNVIAQSLPKTVQNLLGMGSKTLHALVRRLRNATFQLAGSEVFEQ